MLLIIMRSCITKGNAVDRAVLEELSVKSSQKSKSKIFYSYKTTI